MADANPGDTAGLNYVGATSDVARGGRSHSAGNFAKERLASILDSTNGSGAHLVSVSL